MIPVNELRIGSWIQSSENGQFQIEAINHDADGFEGYYAVYRKGGSKTLCECIDPIALTPAVLERCEGFIRMIDKSVYFTTFQGRFHIIDLEGLEPRYRMGYHDEGKVQIRIYHLHQLQNLFFALTGAEITYKNS